MQTPSSTNGLTRYQLQPHAEPIADQKHIQALPASVQLVPISVKEADGSTMVKSFVAAVLAQGFTSAISFGLHKPMREDHLPGTYAAEPAYAAGYIDWVSACLLAAGSCLGDYVGKRGMQYFKAADLVVDAKSDTGWVSNKTVGKVAFIGCFAVRNVLFKDLVTPQGSFTIGAIAKGLTLATGIVAAKCSNARDMILKPVEISDKKQAEIMACKAIGAVFFVAAGGLARSASPAMNMGAINSESESVGATVLRTAIALGAWFEVQDFLRYKFTGQKDGIAACFGGKLSSAVAWVRGWCGKKEEETSAAGNTSAPLTPRPARAAAVPLELAARDRKSASSSFSDASSLPESNLNPGNPHRPSISTSQVSVTSEEDAPRSSTAGSDSELRRRRGAQPFQTDQLPEFKASEFSTSPPGSPAKQPSVQIHQHNLRSSSRLSKS